LLNLGAFLLTVIHIKNDKSVMNIVKVEEKSISITFGGDRMKKLLVSLTLGIIAGILDVIPMLIQRLDWYSNASAFFQWVFLGLVINYIDIRLTGWLKGFIIAEALSIPVMILVSKSELFSVIPIIIMCALLGSLVGALGQKYARIS